MLDYCGFIGYTKLCLRNAKSAHVGVYINNFRKRDFSNER